MGSTVDQKNVGHAVCVPFPAQGHINPMLQLAKLLHQRGFHITFVNTEYNHKRLLKSRGPHSLDDLPGFHFRTIPDGLPPGPDVAADSTQDVPSLCDSTAKNCLPPFRELLSSLNQSQLLPVHCIVSDLIMSFTIDAAQEFGIPNFLFWTASASGLWAYIHYQHLLDKNFVPLKDETYLSNGYLDSSVIDWIPGLEGITLKYFPSFMRTTNSEDIMLRFPIGQIQNAKKASSILINTFDELESDVLKHLSLALPPIYTIGPLQLLQDDDQMKDDQVVNSLASNLWKEQPGCLEWLDSKETGSVVYVNFGSVTVMSAQQLIEFGWGVANSKRDFLWVIRPDLINGESAILPPELLEETKERGLFASWSPQEEVLRHPSIGGFLTHCGWNSTLEGLCGGGVPLICWPFFAEQQTNCWFCCNKWGIGMEIDSVVKRNEVQSLIWELMEGEKGKQMKNKAMKWKRAAQEAIATTTTTIGSSRSNFERLINTLHAGP